MGAIKEFLFNFVMRGKNGTGGGCEELYEAWREVQVREMAFWSCVNLIANAVGKCEFKTYRNQKSIIGAEYYLWNFEPNTNQNSTAFIHKLIAQLYSKNEALVIQTKKRDGTEGLVVADSWDCPDHYPSKQDKYHNVTVGNVTYNKTFSESDVLHFTLNHKNVKTVVDGVYASYSKLIDATMKWYQKDHGNHWIVHINRSAQGKDDETILRAMVENQFRPFINSNGAVLPETEGYEYRDVSKGGGSTSRDMRAMIDDIFDYYANAFGIPPVLLKGQVEGTIDAVKLWLTTCIDPLCDQLAEEITRKRYGFEEWSNGNFLKVDTSAILHFDMFDAADAVDKLISSGFVSINEVRAAAGQDRIEEPWAGVHFITKNYSTVEDLLTMLKGGTNSA